MLDEVLDCGNSFGDSLVGGDDSVFHRDVEVAADENFLAGYFNVFDGFLVVVHWNYSLSYVIFVKSE